MPAICLSDDIYYVGVNDRRIERFENHINLQHGVSYNSYLIVDEKVALIDPVESDFMGEYLFKIKEILGDRKVDYLIINHDEPDHSSSIYALTLEYPDVVVVGNAKTFAPLEAFYGEIKNKKVVAEAEILPLGKHNLQFFPIPMVHWPESMVSYETTEKIAFTNDAFGGFGTLDGTYFDDEANLDFYEDEMRLYYSNIVGKVSIPAQKAVQKLSGLEVKMIAPSHGLIWRSNVAWVVEKYTKFATWEGEEGVVIVYGSMYGNTARMADIIARGIVETGVKNVRIYDVSKTPVSTIISEIWKYKGVALGSCAHYGDVFPPMSALLDELVNIAPKNKQLAIFGGMSWSGGGVRCLNGFADKIKWNQVFGCTEVKGAPIRHEDIDTLYQLGKALGEAVK